MKFWMACITAYKTEFGVANAARVLVAENEENAYLAAAQNCKETFPPEQGYVIHDVYVEYLCDEHTGIEFNAPDGHVYTVTLARKQEE